jgi:hypothetical protein
VVEDLLRKCVVSGACYGGQAPLGGDSPRLAAVVEGLLRRGVVSGACRYGGTGHCRGSGFPVMGSDPTCGDMPLLTARDSHPPLGETPSGGDSPPLAAVVESLLHKGVVSGLAMARVWGTGTRQ